MNSKFSKRVKIALAAIILFSFFGCSKGGSDSQGNKTVSGLTSIEASKIAYAKIKGGFEDTVLYRAIPVDDKNSTNPLLDKNWYENDISGGWFFWFADAKGTDWFMVEITGKSITYTDIGTRSFTAETMPADWPRESFKVSMKEAGLKAKSQGANLDTLTWIEFNCHLRTKPVWALNFSEELGGSTLNYTIFVDGINGSVLEAINDKGDTFALPIDREALQKTRKENHENDLKTFFDLLSKKDFDFTIFQLAYDLRPNDASAQMWKENFQSIKSIKVISIELHRLPEWTAEREYYKVTLDIKTDEPPEKYGWENGVNVRWITIIPQGAGPWKIEEFSTSP
jgi:hypothetical protein